jgi:hypothetical protein
LSAYKFLGGPQNSEIWNKVKLHFLKKAINAAASEERASVGVTKESIEQQRYSSIKIAGDSIKRFLGQYTEEQQKVLLGDTRDELLNIATVARSVFKTDTEMPISFAAQAVKLHIPMSIKADKAWAMSWLFQACASSPWLIKVLGNMNQDELDIGLRWWLHNEQFMGPGSALQKMLALRGSLFLLRPLVARSVVQEQFEGPGTGKPSEAFKTGKTGIPLVDMQERGA